MAVNNPVGDSARKGAVRKRTQSATAKPFFQRRASGAGRLSHGDAQLTLFASPTAAPQGLRCQPDFISAHEEKDLIGRIRALPLAPFQFGAFEGHRRVAWFGWQYDYSQRQLEQADAIPAWIEPFIARIKAFADLRESSIRQILCTEYAVGVGIGWHRDKPYFAEVFGLSLASACKFRFRRKTGDKWDRFTLEAQPRSLYMMSGEARHVWEHSIPPVQMARYSITFRTMATKQRPSSTTE
jgi:alkylated DNA repair dioxygenase AlkB